MSENNEAINEDTAGRARPEQSEPPPITTPDSEDNRSLMHLWLRMGGYFVILLGFITIIGAITVRHRYHVAPLVVAGLLLMGCAYVLAGQALSEGKAWPMPLAAFACVTGIGFTRGLSLVGLVAVLVLYSTAGTERALTRGSDAGAMRAFGLWLGGLALMMLEWVLQI